MCILSRLNCILHSLFYYQTLTKLLEDAHSPEEPSLLPNRAFLTPPGGQLVRTLVGHKSGVHGLAISHGGDYLIAGNMNRLVRDHVMATPPLASSAGNPITLGKRTRFGIPVPKEKVGECPFSIS